MKRLFLFSCLFVFLASLPIGASFAQDDSNPPCWGSDKPCEDGKFRDYQGKEQPASCDNFSATGKAESHDCACERTTTCSRPNKPVAMTAKCKTYCRPKDCKCAKEYS